MNGALTFIHVGVDSSQNARAPQTLQFISVLIAAELYILVTPFWYSKFILQRSHSTVYLCAERDMQIVDKNVKKKSLNTWYEAQLLPDIGRSRRVYCYISPRVSTLNAINVLSTHFG